MAIGIESRVRIAPAIWPGVDLPIQPGDLRRYADSGLDLDVPRVVRPWDDPFESPNTRFYGATERSGDPIRDAPLNDDVGGTVYFRADLEDDALAEMLRIMGLQRKLTEYAVFAEEASDPKDQRFLAQVRIVGISGLASVYGIGSFADFATQSVTVAELVDAFITEQRRIWGTGMSAQLRGIAGGDGDWAKEALAFGFMTENAFHGIYRIWSRAWLVTK